MQHPHHQAKSLPLSLSRALTCLLDHLEWTDARQIKPLHNIHKLSSLPPISSIYSMPKLLLKYIRFTRKVKRKNRFKSILRGAWSQTTHCHADRNAPDVFVSFFSMALATFSI